MEISVPTLINMFMCNTWRAANDQYKKLKQQELTWEQLLTEVTLIDDEESCWDSLKWKEAHEGNCCPVPGNGGKRAKSSSKKQKNALLDCAEEFCQILNISQDEYQKRVWERFCLCCGKKGHYIGDCKANTPSNLWKAGRIKFAWA